MTNSIKFKLKTIDVLKYHVLYVLFALYLESILVFGIVFGIDIGICAYTDHQDELNWYSYWYWYLYDIEIQKRSSALNFNARVQK